jgi:hypothetical protein
VQATELGPLPQNPDILGRDAVLSALFQGFSVWLYGDTVLANPDASRRNFVSNSWSYTSDLVASDGIAGFHERLDSVGAPTMILKETPDEQAFNAAHSGSPCPQQPCGARWALWPMSVVTDPVANRALIFYLVVSDLPGDFNFQSVGSSVAIWQNFTDSSQRPAFRPALVADHPDLMFNQNEPDFGSAALISGGTLYVYGCGHSSDGLDKSCRLARVNPASVQDRSSWRFYAGGNTWSPSVGDAVSVFEGDDTLSVAWNGYLQRYIAVYSVSFSQDVVLRTAPTPEGPWSAELLAFTAMPPVKGNTHDAHAHAEYDSDNGRTLYVSYSRELSAATMEVRLVAVHLHITGPLP